MSANNCQIRNSQEKGEGVYALRSFKKGELVYNCQIEENNIENSVHASQSDIDQWILFTKMGRTVNHSCDPNCGVGYDGHHWQFIAFKDIQEGEELTYDYAMSNYKIDHFPKCLCESQKCRGEIKGFRSLPDSRRKEYSGFLAPYIQKMMQNQMQ